MSHTKLKIGMLVLVTLVGIAAGQSNQTTHCIFYRESAFTGKALHASIRIDSDEPKHKLPSGRYWATDLTPGEHLIYSDLERYSRKYQLESDKTYYFRVEFRLNPPTVFGKMRFQIVPVEAEIATGEMTGLKPD
jgi:hypothetical protein